jgi:hypothetical protein
MSPAVGLGHEPLEHEPQWTRRTSNVERQREWAEALAAARARKALAAQLPLHLVDVRSSRERASSICMVTPRNIMISIELVVAACAE